MKLLEQGGTGVALVTPFRNDKVDFTALERIIHFVIEGGADFVVSLGTTGEAITLTADEVSETLQFTIKCTAGRVPVVAGFFGDNYTERLAQKLRSYNLEGVAAIMSSNPSYNKPTQEGIFRHYMAVAEASPLPLVMYNVPGRTASNVQAETTLRLANATDKFLAVKEASGDLTQAMKILKEKPERFQLWSGDDVLTLPLIACGATGVISVIANAFPAAFSAMVSAALRGDLAEARRLNALLLDVHPHLYAEGNPAGIKAAMEILGLCSREVRLPLTPATDELMLVLKKAVSPILER